MRSNHYVIIYTSERLRDGLSITKRFNDVQVSVGIISAEYHKASRYL